MLIHFGADTFEPVWPRCLVCIGTFDGVHLGHQQVIGTAVSLALERESPSVLVTFDRHPAEVVAPDRRPLNVASLCQNLRSIERLGMSVSVVLHFDRNLASMSPQEFFDEVLVGRLRADLAVVGHDFAFGKDRAGSLDWLGKHMQTVVVPPFELEGHRVSSREIRELIRTGEVAHAAKLLGRRFAVEGVVTCGDRVGRTLGYPTANLGVCRTVRGSFKAAISVGVRPTVGEGARRAEAFLLDYPGDSLYGTAVTFEFAERLRDEERYSDLESLKAQIARDVQRVAALRLDR
jgi:riboflavin kinase/FMN adenylyltransferase